MLNQKRGYDNPNWIEGCQQLVKLRSVKVPSDYEKFFFSYYSFELNYYRINNFTSDVLGLRFP